MSNVKGLRLTLSKNNHFLPSGIQPLSDKQSFLKGEHLHMAGPLAL